MTQRATTNTRMIEQGSGYWWRRTVILGLGIGLLAISLPVSHGQQSPDLKDEYTQHMTAALKAEQIWDYETGLTEKRKCLSIALYMTQEYPEVPHCWFYLGSAFLQLGRLDEAKQALPKALHAAGIMNLVVAYLWECHMRQGAYGEAVKIAELGVRECPDVEKSKLPEKLESARQLEREKQELDKWLATASVPGGRKLTVFAPGLECAYDLERRGGRNRVSLSLYAIYRGKAENREKVRRRLAAAVAWVEGFYRRNGVDLELQCCFESGKNDWQRCGNTVYVYDNWASAMEVLATTHDWPMLARNGHALPESVLFVTVAHEVGHWLGLKHPKNMDAHPGDLMGPVGNDGGREMVLTPVQVRQILRPLHSPTPVDQVRADLGAASKSFPMERMHGPEINKWGFLLQRHPAELQKITELEPDNTSAWYLLGHATTNYTDKVKVYTRVIELVTTRKDRRIETGDDLSDRRALMFARLARASALVNLNQCDRALADLNELIENPNVTEFDGGDRWRWWAKLYRAKALIDLERLEAALADLNWIVKNPNIDEDDAWGRWEAKLYRAFALRKLEQLDAALVDLDEIIKNPNIAEVRDARGSALITRASIHALQKNVAALERDAKDEELDRVLELYCGKHRDDPSAVNGFRLVRANLLDMRGKKSEAVSELLKVFGSYGGDDKAFRKQFRELQKYAVTASVRAPFQQYSVSATLQETPFNEDAAVKLARELVAEFPEEQESWRLFTRVTLRTTKHREAMVKEATESKAMPATLKDNLLERVRKLKPADATIVTREFRSGTLNEALREVFASFPILKCQTTESGMPKFEEIELNNPPRVLHEGRCYDGFRIKTPANLSGSFVWGCYVLNSPGFRNWYILPREEYSGFKGFHNFYRYLPFKLTTQETPNGKPFNKVYVQALDKSSLKPDTEYLMWFGFNDADPVSMMVAHTFDKSPDNSDNSKGAEVLSVFGLQER